MIKRLSAKLPNESPIKWAKRIIAAIAVIFVVCGGALPAFAALSSDNARPVDNIAVTATVQEDRHADDPAVDRSQRHDHGDENQSKAAPAADQTPASEPAAEPAAPAATPAAPPAQPACASGSYTVKKDESLASIAVAAGYLDAQGAPDWQRIYLCNKDLLGDNPNLIRVGWVLKLDNPAPAPAPAAPEVAPAPAPAPPAPPAPAELPGDTMSLAQLILDSPNISFQTPDERVAMQHIAATGHGVDCGGPEVSPKLLRVFLLLSKEFKIVIGVVVDGHKCDGLNHPKGHAADINGVNALDGSAGTGNFLHFEAQDMSFIRQFYQRAGEILAANGGGGLGQEYCFGGPAPEVPGVSYFDDDCSHLHMSDLS